MQKSLSLLIVSVVTSCLCAQGLPELNEPGNDSPAGAESGVCGAQHYGNFDGSSLERDYWRFTIHPGDPLDLMVWTSARGAVPGFLGGTSCSDTMLSVYDTDGATSLGFNDDEDDSGTLFSKLSVRLPRAGTYYAAVEPFGTDAGDYAFDIVCGDFLVPFGPPCGSVANGSAELEPNDDITTATPLACCQRVSATLGALGDTDFYALIVATDSRLTWQTFANSVAQNPLTDSRIWLYDSAGTLLAEDDDGGVGLMSRLTAELRSGAYFLEVSHWMRNGVGDYHVTQDCEVALAPLPVRVLPTQVVSGDSSGCPGANGVPMSIVARLGDRPGLGSTWTCDIDGARAASVALIGFAGFDPGLDLGLVGAPGCVLLVNPAIAGLALTPTVGDEAEFGLFVRARPGQLGLRLVMQAAAIDFGANTLGVITSNRIVATLGN